MQAAVSDASPSQRFFLGGLQYSVLSGSLAEGRFTADLGRVCSIGALLVQNGGPTDAYSTKVP
jgi:hypothetical protein